MRFAALIITVLPLASIGGVIELFISGEYLSVPASVGFISVMGNCCSERSGSCSYIRKLRSEGMSQEDAVLEGLASASAR